LFEYYRKITDHHKKLDLKVERKLISLAKKDDRAAKEKLLFHLTGFFIFRIQKTLYPFLLRQYGEDILQDCLLLALNKFKSYKMGYINKKGQINPLHMSTYLWKSVTGLILTYVKEKREVSISSLPEGVAKEFLK